MHLMSNSAPMTVANQHWVLCPEGMNIDDPNIVLSAQAVYATSPEAAVEQIRNLYRLGDFGEPAEPAGLSKIRLAEGAELPWNDPKCIAFVVMVGRETHMMYDMDYEEILGIWKNASVRRATPAEVEESIRARTVEQDEEDEEQFNYGFNVLYKERLENGDTL